MKNKIIIPKEETEQETLSYICPQTKKQCDDECCVSAEECHIEASFGIISDCEPSKQETLEEAAENYVKGGQTYCMEKTFVKQGFIEGAKWQSEKTTVTLDDAYSEGFENGKNYQTERMYSEEEVLHILTKFWSWSTSSTKKEDLINWFKKYKK